jgi:uncharacterized phage protein gp47/JayE
VTYVPRTYDQVVRDLLTTLTGGTVRETLTAPLPGPPIVLDRLSRRPVRRISHLEGTIAIGEGPDAPQIPYRFTDADFELVATSGDPEDKDAIRFRDGGRTPVPGSVLTVNYYPVQTDPVPVNDLNVGSVVRTLLETVGRELALTYQHLEHVYRSAFIDTAEAGSLDNVVALVGMRRLPAGHPVARVRLGRGSAPGAGRVTVPAGTAVTDAEGNRYLTQAEVTLEAGEPSREVAVAGESAGTPLVSAGALDRLEVLVAGIGEVANPQPARALSVPETDDELRRRARGALHAVPRGTVDALAFGLRSIPGVKELQVIEAPNGVFGEVRIEVAYADPADDEVQRQVALAIEELRPAGVRVVTGAAATLRVDVQVTLTLAGAGVSGAELAALQQELTERLTAFLRAARPGGVVRRAQLAALALEDPRIVDAAFELRPHGRAATETLELRPGEVLEVGDIGYAPALTETAPVAGAAVASVSALLPVHLLPGVTAAAATAAIDAAFDSHLATRAPGAPLTVDGLAADLRDDTRYVLVRSEIQVTVEAGERFRQLTDGVGDYPLGPGETLHRGTVTVDVREGSV